MITLFRRASALLLFSLLPFAQLPRPGEKQAATPPALANFPEQYPDNGVGVLAENSGWLDLSQVSPSKVRTKRGLLGPLTYGVVAAVLVAEYSGRHAKVKVETHRPVFCICNAPADSGVPALVRLQTTKDSRELDGGNLRLPGAKVGDAKKSSLVPTEIVQPESGCWLVRPREDIPVGEYGVMLGPQNFSIFALTIADPPVVNPATDPKKP